MACDVQATRLASSGVVSAGRGRVMKVYIVGAASAGSVVIKDGGASGTTLLTINTPAGATLTQDVSIPGDGILCATSIYATLTNVTAVTVFYG